jgi:hypothetical protein
MAREDHGSRGVNVFQPTTFRRILSIALLIAAIMMGRPAESLPSTAEPLRLRTLVVDLPRARRGVTYEHTLDAWGGTPPRKFEVVSGELPAGLTLAPDGQLRGVPTGAIGVYPFTIEAKDSAVPPKLAQQSYELRVESAETAPSEAAPTEWIPKLSAKDQRELTAAASGHVTVYVLTKACLDVIAPPEPAVPPVPPKPCPGATPTSEGESAVEQSTDKARTRLLQDVLTPFVGVEYPTMSLFARAVGARATDLKLSESQRANIFSPLEWAKIIRAATTQHDGVPPNPILWDGSGCGCAIESPTQQVYGMYPFWMAGRDSQPIDFGLLNRVGYFAVQFDDGGAITDAMHWTSKGAGFVRVAQTHRTKVDLVLYRNDWNELLGLPQINRDAATDAVARNVLALLNTPLTDPASRMQAYVPFFRSTPAMGDGVTVYFDNYPGPDDRLFAAFNEFLRKLIAALIANMTASHRAYALNIVVSDEKLGRAGAFGYEEMFQYIVMAEHPEMPNGRIEQDRNVYRSKTNVEVHFLVLLGEPTKYTKKKLRWDIEASTALQGNNRRVFLRKVIPIVTYNGVKPVQLADDLVYFQDNFAGAGFWPVPIRDGGLGTKIYGALNGDFRAARTETTNGFCEFVCPRRWLLRVLFEALVLIGALSLGLYIWVCRVRNIGRAYVVFLLLGAAVPILLTGGALYGCDPALARVRQSYIPLMFLIAAPLLWAFYVNLRKQVAQP